MSLNSLDWDVIGISQKDGYLTRGQIARYLGVCEATVGRWELKKLLPYYRVGSRKFYKREEIDEWMKKNKF